MLNVKVSPKDDTDKLAFILMDEMSLRKGLSKSEPNDKTVGYEDDDKQKSGKLVTSSLCVMAVGVKRQWKYPSGYYLSLSVIKSAEITQITSDAIEALEEEGFRVLGITSDQGSNLKSVFEI